MIFFWISLDQNSSSLKNEICPWLDFVSFPNCFFFILFLFHSFYHCNILTLYWQFRAIKMFFCSNLIFSLNSELWYNWCTIWWFYEKNVSLFWKLLFHPSLPLHCVTVRKKNKISNANIPHLECQKPTLTSIYNTIGDKTVILGCTKKFSISKIPKKENLYSYTYILTTN